MTSGFCKFLQSRRFHLARDARQRLIASIDVQRRFFLLSSHRTNRGDLDDRMKFRRFFGSRALQNDGACLLEEAIVLI